MIDGIWVSYPKFMILPHPPKKIEDIPKDKYAQGYLDALKEVYQLNQAMEKFEQFRKGVY